MPTTVQQHTQLLFYRNKRAFLLLSVQHREDISAFATNMQSNPKTWPTAEGLWVVTLWRPENKWHLLGVQRPTLHELVDIHEGSWTPTV